MNLALWLHLVHVAAATVWVGGGVTLSVIGIRVRRNADPPLIRDFARLMSRLLPEPGRLAAHARGDTPDDAPRPRPPAGLRPTLSP
jgi:hypothetical protein